MAEIKNLKERLYVGKNVRIPVLSFTYDDQVPKKRIETCTVTGIYPHIVTFRRSCGMSTSYTYPELIIMGL